MSKNLQEFLNILQPYFPDIFLNNEYIEYITELSCHLPVSSLGGFECFFGNDQQRFDFNICIKKIHDEHNRIADWINEKSHFNGRC